MFGSSENALLIDIGTNGEILLKHNGKYYAASAAAGPALEGGNIECGMGGAAGAIDHVYYSGGSPHIYDNRRRRGKGNMRLGAG